MRFFLSFGIVAAMLLGALSAVAQTEPSQDERLKAMLAQPRPIDAVSSYWIEDLTWMEVRDAIAGGATTVIIPTGGIEQNGPYLATGKHNVILSETCPAIAAKLDGALCAPVVGFVPEGSINPPSGLMQFPGTISVQQSTFVALLTDIADSLKQHGFKNVVLIGDSGGNQKGLKATAEALNDAWGPSGARAHYIKAFYEPGWTATEEFAAESLGVTQTENDGLHDDIYVTAMMMVADPQSVRYAQRKAVDLASINGVDISDSDATILLGKKMIDFRASLTADAIKAAIGSR